MKTKQIIIGIALLVIGIAIGKVAFSGNDTNTVKVDKHQGEIHEEHWTCSMHPQIDMPQFGQCPICGMDLIPKESGIDDENQAPNSFKMSKNAMALANIETLVIGSNTSENETDKSLPSVRLTGKIIANEKKTRMQTAHFGGRIERLVYKSVGEYVTSGSLIASLYSPELVTAQNEFIEALEIINSQPELYKAVRNKLKNWKISEKQIQQLEYTKKVITNFNMYANVSGFISKMFVEEGNHVKEGAPLFQVADLSTVWANLDAYEQDVQVVKKGQKMSLSFNAFPNQKIQTTIDYIDPQLNTKTRTVSVRATLHNKANKLKPGMLVTAEVLLTNKAHQPTGIKIPKSAVLWTGKRSVVYVKVAKDEPVFELRELGLGSDLGNYYEIISGLKNGEEVVVNGTFTVDAAAQLLGKKSMMNKAVNQ